MSFSPDSPSLLLSLPLSLFLSFSFLHSLFFSPPSIFSPLYDFFSPLSSILSLFLSLSLSFFLLLIFIHPPPSPPPHFLFLLLLSLFSHFALFFLLSLLFFSIFWLFMSFFLSPLPFPHFPSLPFYFFPSFSCHSLTVPVNELIPFQFLCQQNSHQYISTNTITSNRTA